MDKSKHYAKYQDPINVRAYSLLICLERFQHFLNEQRCTGVVIYEKFFSQQKRKVGRAMERLKNMQYYHSFSDSVSMRRNIINGDPIKEKVLQFSDFFAYAPHMRMVSDKLKHERWDEIKNRYYV